MSGSAPASALDTLHEQDFSLWSREQARLLEEKRFCELDLLNLIDEVKALGNARSAAASRS